MKKLGIRALCALVATLSGVAGCGGEGGSYGVCDRSQIASHDCIEATGPNAGSARGDCTSQGGTWSEGSCPDANLIGICSYPLFDLDIRQFYYVDPDRTGNPMSQCTNTVHNGTPGVWESATP